MNFNCLNKLGSSFQQSTHKMFWPDQYSYFRHVLNMFCTYFFIISIYNWSDLQSTHKMFWSIHIFQTCLVYNSWLSQKQSTTFGLFQQMVWLILIYLSNMYKVYISWMLGFVATRQFHCFKWIHNITIPWRRS